MRPLSTIPKLPHKNRSTLSASQRSCQLLSQFRERLLWQHVLVQPLQQFHSNTEQQLASGAGQISGKRWAKSMWSTTCGCLLFLLQVMVTSTQEASEFLFGELERSNFSTGFRRYRMGLGGFLLNSIPPSGCKCHRDPVLPEEIICICRGPGVKEFKANLTKGVTRL